MRDSDQALFHDGELLVVDEQMIALLKRRALGAPHRRFRLCLHQSQDEAVQEMLVVHCRDNYSRPHAHPIPSSMLVLEGALTVFTFTDDGAVDRRIELGPRGSGKPFCLRLEAGVWHMPVCRTPQLVFYETMAGPFRRDAVNLWAPWSPDEDDADGITAYLAGLRVWE